MDDPAPPARPPGAPPCSRRGRIARSRRQTDRPGNSLDRPHGRETLANRRTRLMRCGDRHRLGTPLHVARPGDRHVGFAIPASPFLADDRIAAESLAFPANRRDACLAVSLSFPAIVETRRGVPATDRIRPAAHGLAGSGSHQRRVASAFRSRLAQAPPQPYGRIMQPQRHGDAEKDAEQSNFCHR